VNALAEGLSSFEGTVFVVSHDQDLIGEVATRVLAFRDDGLLDYLGTWEEYLSDHPLTEREHHGKKG
jgi:ATPase subunit of ABC transporter with duplicated ATPase domains